MKDRNPNDNNRVPQQQPDRPQEKKPNAGQFEKGTDRAREAGRKGGRAAG